ncbi:MAG: fibronectin type III domain-containing protein [Vicinamibacterales bacterium]
MQPAPWGGRTTVPSGSSTPTVRESTRHLGQGRAGFWIVDSDTLQATFSALLPNSTWIPTVRRVPRPARPQQLAATVQGASVALTWTEGVSVAQTLRYVLEVGSAPGLNNIFSGLDVGLQTSFGASGVPPGTYYVRVRAGNYTGLGAPSNEVAVVVP